MKVPREKVVCFFLDGLFLVYERLFFFRFVCRRLIKISRVLLRIFLSAFGQKRELMWFVNIMNWKSREMIVCLHEL